MPVAIRPNAEGKKKHAYVAYSSGYISASLGIPVSRSINFAMSALTGVVPLTHCETMDCDTSSLSANSCCEMLLRSRYDRIAVPGARLFDDVICGSQYH